MPPTDNKVSLGCGTLILIALIVMLFGNSNRNVNKDTREQISKIQVDVNRLKTDIQKQNESLESIKKMLGEIQKSRPSPRPRVIVPAIKPLTPEAPLPEN